MPNANDYSKLGYLAIKKEATAGVAVYPNVPIEILNESLKINWDFSSVSQIAGKRAMDIRPVLNQVGPFEGSIEFYAEPYGLGHFFTGLFGEAVDTTISASASYQHDFEPLNTLQTYTMDVAMGNEDYVKRFFGVCIKKLTLTKDNNIIKVSMDVMAQRVFENARLTVAHSSGTLMDLDQTSGLTTSDTLIVLNDTDAGGSALAEYTISSITSEVAMQVSTISASLGVDDIVVIKRQTFDTEAYLATNEFIWAGGADVYVANGANAMQGLAAKTNVEDFEISFENELEAHWAATGRNVVDRMPSAIVLKGSRTAGKFTQFHTSPEFLDMLRQNEQVGLRFNFYGAALAANAAAAATGVLESDGAGQVTVTADTAGDASNDYAIVVVQGASTLSASISGKVITVTLDADAADNAVALVAAVIDALSGVTATSSSTGNVTTTDNPDKVEFSGGRDASERELMRVDLPNARLNPFDANLAAEDTINEEIPFTAFWDENDEREVKVRLRNATADY